MGVRFTIFFSTDAKEDLKSIRAHDRQMILDAIETQLIDAPTLETKKRKFLRNLVPPFDAIPPIWQLRVGTFRVFYDVSEEQFQVFVRAVRRKPAHLTTEDIL